MKFDVELLGNCDEIVCELCRRLGDGWELAGDDVPHLKEIQYCQLDQPSPSDMISPCLSDESGILPNEPLSCDLNDSKTTLCETNSTSEHMTEPVHDTHLSNSEQTNAQPCESSDSVLKCHGHHHRHSSHGDPMEQDDTCYSRDKSLDERRKFWSSSERYSMAKSLKGI